MTTVSTHGTIKIVASDLDGTLLAPNHQLSEYSKQALKALHQHGYTFIFATGRHHIDVAGIRETVGIPAYMITSNGARVHNPDDTEIFSRNLPAHLVQQVIDQVKHDDSLYLHIYTSNKWYLNREDKELNEYHDESGFSYELFDVNNAPTDDVSKIFITQAIKDHDYIAEVETKLIKLFGKETSIAFSTPWCLEVMGPKVSKGDALQKVAELLNLTLENCIAFGDGMNDVEMLSMAGKGLIMQTAHERVFQALPQLERIGSNADDAVARYLRKHLMS
jgi:Cof subfamily protein (haloacid dehalogenase superfamily)